MTTKVTKADRTWVMCYAHGMSTEESLDFDLCLHYAWRELKSRKQNRRFNLKPEMHYDYTERKEMSI